MSQGSVGPPCGLRSGRARASHAEAEEVGALGSRVVCLLQKHVTPASACPFLRVWAQRRSIAGAVPLRPCTCVETRGPLATPSLLVSEAVRSWEVRCQAMGVRVVWGVFLSPGPVPGLGGSGPD